MIELTSADRRDLLIKRTEVPFSSSVGGLYEDGICLLDEVFTDEDVGGSVS